MSPYIKDENACNAIENWLKSLKYKADFVTVNLGDYDHGGICIKDGVFVVYEPFSRCLISFVGIPLDKNFVKTVKEHDVARYADFFKVKIKSLIGKELNENKS